MNLLAVCGSLRTRSSNLEILKAYASVAAPAHSVRFVEGLAALPHFNPDEDGAVSPESVVRWRSQMAQADAWVVSTPEYAHGLPGAFKNGLDWLVSAPGVIAKPVVILSAERGRSFALESLREILRTMSLRLIEEAAVSVPLGSNRITDREILELPCVRRKFEESIQELDAVGRA